MVIKRDPKGAKIKGPVASGPGAEKSVVSVQVTYDSKVKESTLKELEQLIWETATGSKKPHQSSNASGNVAGANGKPAPGYIHSKGNKHLLLISRLDTNKHTIEIIREGVVNGGVHQF
jgi:hypothetical protein